MRWCRYQELEFPVVFSRPRRVRQGWAIAVAGITETSSEVVIQVETVDQVFGEGPLRIAGGTVVTPKVGSR